MLKKILGYLLLIGMLLTTGLCQAEETDTQRFVWVSRQYLGRQFDSMILQDTKTGVKYLVIGTHDRKNSINGIAIVQLDELYVEE